MAKLISALVLLMPGGFIIGGIIGGIKLYKHYRKKQDEKSQAATLSEGVQA